MHVCQIGKRFNGRDLFFYWSHVSDPKTTGQFTSMMRNTGFAFAYGWNVYYQKILGICSVKGEDKLAGQRAWAWVIWISIFIWIPQASSLLILWGDLNASIECLSTNMPIAVSIAKVAVLQYQRRVLGSILFTIVEDWESVKTKKEYKIMLETARISRSISIISFSLTNIMFLEYIAFRLWLLMQNGDIDSNPRLAFGLLHDSYFPFDTTKLSVFVPLWILQFFGTFFGMISYAGPDCLVSMVVLHLCGQLKIVRHSLKHLVDESTIRDPKIYWQAVATIVKRHEQLNQMAFVIKETFSSILLVQMVACSLTFCFQGYAMCMTLMDRNDVPVPVLDLAFSLLYAVYTIIHLFVYCYVGDKLFVESTSISDDVYKTQWYNLAPKEAKAVLLVCHRAKIPLEIKAGKFCEFNLHLFNAVIKNSMGYLSMLIAMNERLAT